MSSVIHPSFVFRPIAAAVIGAVLGFPISLSAASPDPVLFDVEDVGSGVFKSAQMLVKPGDALDGRRALCLTLAGGSFRNSDELLEWMRSNRSGAALADRPSATVTVPDDRPGIAKGVYRLDNITVRSFRLVADRDLTDPRLGAAEINCDAVESEL